MTVIDRPEAAQRRTTPTSDRSPWAKARILETADALFYAEGIRTIGIDRLITESAVTKATFYKHYGSKDKLIVDYIAGRHDRVKEFVTATIAESTRPEDVLRAVLAALTTSIAAPGFRGSPFLNAAAEFSDPAHAVRRIVQAHRDWLTEVLTEQLTLLGHPMSGNAADDLILAMDGAQSGGYASDPVAASAALTRVFERVITAASER